MRKNVAGGDIEKSGIDDSGFRIVARVLGSGTRVEYKSKDRFSGFEFIIGEDGVAQKLRLWFSWGLTRQSKLLDLDALRGVDVYRDSGGTVLSVWRVDHPSGGFDWLSRTSDR